MTALSALGIGRQNLDAAGRGEQSHSLRRRRSSRVVRSRVRAPFPRRPRAVDSALKAFRAKFTGKASPVHFFWGTFDLSLSLFSGRAASPVPTDRIGRVAFADEQIELGFWPGDARLRAPAYYSFAYPPPPLSKAGHPS